MPPVDALTMDGALRRKCGQLGQFRCEEGRKLILRHLAKGHGKLAMLNQPKLTDMSVDRHIVGQQVMHLKAYNDRSLSEIVIDDIVLPSTALLARGPEATELLQQILDNVTLAICAESVGAMDRALAITMDYMKTRKQFDRAIADFQALRHRLVEHSLVLFNARSLVRIAALAMSGDDKVSATKAVAAAKWYAGRAARQVGHDVLQLHGAIGFQDETAISHYGKFLVSLDAMMGDAEYQMTRFVAG